MSHERDYHYYSTPPRSLRSPAPSQEISSSYTGQGGHTRLPPIASVFPTSRSPAPSTYSSQYGQQRQYGAQYDYGMPAYSNEWLNSSSSTQPHAGYTSTYEEPRLVSSYQGSRTAAPTSSSSYEARNYTASSTQPAYWDERYATGYGAASPQPSTSSHGGSTSTYDSRYNNQTPPYGTSGSYSYAPPTENSSAYTYAYTPAYEPRASSLSQAPFTSAPFASAPAQPSTASARSVPSATRGSRAHTRSAPLFAPYAPYTRHAPRGSANTASATNSSSTVPIPHAVEDAATSDEPIKKKRKRADANQLKVLNEVYDRNPFPPTAEREALAAQLRMTPRSVQIWFQNKRQAQRQGGRGSSVTTAIAVPSTTTTIHTGTTPPGRTSTSMVSMSSGSTIPRPGSTQSMLAHAIAVPSSSAPRGTPGYVASPPPELYPVSSPPTTGTTIPRGASPTRAPSTMTTSEVYSARRTTTRGDESAYYTTRSSSRLR